MNKTRKRLIWEQDKHEALKILLELSDPEIWIDYGIYRIQHDLMVSQRAAKNLFWYWQKRWNFNIHTNWRSEGRGLWAMKPMIAAPLFWMKDLDEKVIIDSESHKFSFSMPLTEF